MINIKKGEPTKKIRLDTLLVSKKITENKNRAQGLIMSGKVQINGKTINKAGHLTDLNSNIEIIGEKNPYVSRGGIKLEGALKDFNLNVKDKICIDVGASTGGFTHCLLEHGAKKVYSIDVGYGQFSWQLRNDPRVINFERKNIRYMKPEDLPEKVDLAVIDVSFISLQIVIAPIISLIKKNGEILSLIKPQFEVGKGEVGKGGIVRDPQKHKEVITSISNFIKILGHTVVGVETSKLMGHKGNIEFFIYIKLIS